MKIYFRKHQGNIWVPDTEESVEATMGIKLGTVLGGEFTKPNNYKFFKKMHALVRLTFDRFTEHVDLGLEYKGMKVEPSYDLFRKQMTCLAGFYTATYDMKGNVRVEAKSWSFSNMSEEDREKMFSALINVALRKFFAADLSERQLRELVDQTLAFAS
ncbi:hypothetical protein SKUL_44 [Pseudomonas phage Skulduggery]|uniref:DUF1367 family protein n=1 Tax=Pseudomonas phage Skulduggery TaxID=2006671 RepID=A0A1Y0SZE0_9CAUD|nr:NinB/ Orf homologous recombination mediator [Pseudomonas phage Skulduggery]ARV77143.1 hypothetical protein SKUL_44 [Pseudomonas phage Skulduggery]